MSIDETVETEAFQEHDEEKLTEKKRKYSLVKMIMYPILGALPADIRNKLQDKKLVKKYDLDLEKAAEVSTYIEAGLITFGTPAVSSAFLDPEGVAFTLLCSGVFSVANMGYRFSGAEFDEKPTKGSLLTEIPYKIYKSIKKFSDYINDKEVIKND